MVEGERKHFQQPPVVVQEAMPIPLVDTQRDVFGNERTRRHEKGEKQRSLELEFVDWKEHPLAKPTHTPEAQHQHIKGELAKAKQVGPKNDSHHATLVALETILEMIPGGVGPWGVGDIATAVEAVIGRTLIGWEKLSWTERGIYLVASAIPVVPARPLIAGYRYLKNRSANQPQSK